MGTRGGTGRTAGGRRGPGRPRRPLDAEGILAAAIAIADREGLDAVSIRRIAAALDARPMSIYDHFDSKDDLLSAMADRILAELLVPGASAGDWREAVRALAHRNYALFLSHPWYVILFGRRPVWGPNALAVAVQAAHAFDPLPLDPDLRWTLLGTVLDYVLGYSLRVIASPAPEAFGELLSGAELARRPELASLPPNMRSRTSVERFEAGLELVLDGVEQRLEGGGAGPGAGAS